MSSEKIRVAEYLGALDSQACAKFCQIQELNFLEVLPYQFTDSAQVYECLKLFIDTGMPLFYLFNNIDIWSLYLHSIMEERYHRGLDLVMSTGNPADVIYYLRACYRFGFPALDDISFDVLEKLYIQTYPALAFFNEQTYDEDEYSPIILEAIRYSGVKTTVDKQNHSATNATVNENANYALLNSEKSRSIRPVVSPEEAFEFWRNSPCCRVHFSLKIDGVNTKLLFSEDKTGLELAVSRGRASDSIDYTEAIKLVLASQNVKTELLSGRITGESFVGLEHLKVMQSRYPDKNYKTPKSTAMAMLRAPSNFLDEDYQYLSFFAFDYADMKPDLAFSKFEEAGLSVPPYLEFDGSEIPRSSLEDFCDWMDKNVLDPLYEAGIKLNIGSDGVVMFLLADIDTERRDKYSDSNIALKYSHWSATTYVSKVKSFIFEQKRVEASIVLEIEPVVMRDKNTATRVGVGSPDILIRDGVQIGDTIEFERKSEAYNVYLKKRS